MSSEFQRIPMDEEANEPVEKLNLVLGVIASLLTGFAFGIGMEKAHILEPWSVRGAFLFEVFFFWKIFFAAVSSSFLGVLVVYWRSPDKFDHSRMAYVNTGITNLRLGGFLFGAFLLGAGLCLAGTCSGIVPMQIAIGVENAWFTLGAAFLGAIMFGFVQPQLDRVFRHEDPPHLCNRFADQQLKIPYWKLAVVAVAVMAIGAAALEWAFPYRDEIKAYPIHSEGSIWGLGQFAWYPWISGVIIGLGQIPIMATMSDTLGMSSSFMTLTSQFLRITPGHWFPKWRRYVPLSIGRVWQILFYWIAAPLGAYVSALLSGGKQLGRAGGSSPAQCILGGVLVIFGARLSGGCTQGHGISGCSVLFFGSMFAVPAMILGGIATALLLHLMGEYAIVSQH